MASRTSAGARVVRIDVAKLLRVRNLLVPRLRLGTHCFGGSASRMLCGRRENREAEPRRQRVPRRSLGTREYCHPRAECYSWVIRALALSATRPAVGGS